MRERERQRQRQRQRERQRERETESERETEREREREIHDVSLVSVKPIKKEFHRPLVLIDLANFDRLLLYTTTAALLGTTLRTRGFPMATFLRQ